MKSNNCIYSTSKCENIPSSVRRQDPAAPTVFFPVFFSCILLSNYIYNIVKMLVNLVAVDSFFPQPVRVMFLGK